MAQQADVQPCIIRFADFSDDRVLDLLRLHTAWCNAPENKTSGGLIYNLDVEALRKPNIDLLVAWDCEMQNVLGCVALKTLITGKQITQPAGELKSMHVISSGRGSGVADAMVDHVVQHAKRLGLRKLYLETGTMPAFARARAFYTRQGFGSCAPFGDYVPGENNTFMVKEIS